MTPIPDPPLAEWLAENWIVDPTSSRFTGLRDRIKQFAAEQRAAATRAAHTATAPAFEDMGTALRMIRDAVEELGPIAACSISRDQFEPRPIDDAEAIIVGILKIKDRAEREARADERRRCAAAIGTLENKLWSGQYQLGYDAAKKAAAEAIERGDPA